MPQFAPRPLALMPAPLALVAALAACSGQKAPPMRPPTDVGYVVLQGTQAALSTELTGRITATTSSDVRPQVDGIIRQRLFTEGSDVKAGQALYLIDPRSYKASRDQIAAQIESAKATLITNQNKVDRYRKLSDTQAVSKQDIDDAVAAAGTARASLHQYEANLRAANLNLEYTKVLAPISGRIGRSAYTVGALVSAAQTTALASIQQLDPIYVDITQSSAQLLALRKQLANGSVLPASTTVHLKLEDGSDYPQTGTIEFSEVTVDENAGTVVLRARIPNPQRILLPGMFVRIETPQGVVPNAVLAPQQGVLRDTKGDPYALVVDAQNKVEQRKIKPVKAVGNMWIVSEGLKPGDHLIVQGTDKALPGATVKQTLVKIGG
ncbi:efflux RND transporter periplasmic adaptor subunit [Novosphingobium terrae]|uniref:efflux RND transporter periplasmic adaptor subunit n=1 Tax=Novosphingobium terrae TaxID=2726189 RepID=UPI00197E64BC|nr:efflux RND transporter periplasmic adaptor subunit [Novosphingobium terrae]